MIRAHLFLADRALFGATMFDVRDREADRHVPLDLSVTLDSDPSNPRRFDVAPRRFDVAVRGAGDQAEFADPDAAVREEVRDGRWRDLRTPSLIILVQPSSGEMIVRWLHAPVIGGDGSRLEPDPRPWSPLDAAALDGIVAEVAAWYDAARRDRLRLTRPAGPRRPRG